MHSRCGKGEQAAPETALQANHRSGLPATTCDLEFNTCPIMVPQKRAEILRGGGFGMVEYHQFHAHG
jgi:hypothetical protein